jgi:arginine-tRNA-protein transferase
LDNKEQTTHYKIINDCSAQLTHDLIERGYRRFGRMYFRPICEDCNECQSIKIDVANYSFSKSERRVIRKAKDLDIYIQTPTLTQEHLELFDKYHHYMHKKKGWNFQKVTPDHYYNSFVIGHEDYGKEVLYFYKNKLIAIDLIDILQEGISSIYFYYDPDFGDLSLGKLSLLKQIQFAKETDKAWIYLGYYVEDCPSLNYKAAYKPYTTLQGRPSLDSEYIWT